jgi:hypothetical protein
MGGGDKAECQRCYIRRLRAARVPPVLPMGDPLASQRRLAIPSWSDEHDYARRGLVQEPRQAGAFDDVATPEWDLDLFLFCHPASGRRKPAGVG